MRSIYMKYFFLLMLMCIMSGCTKFVTLDPPQTDLITSSVFSSDQTATATIIGVYTNMMSIAEPGFYGGSFTLYGGLSSDEFQNYSFSKDQSEFAANSIKPTNGFLRQLWSEPYQYIYTANAIIEGLAKSHGVSPGIKSELLGEARFIRAISYFYLVNLWGDVPLALQSAYTVNDTLHRTASSEIYRQIILDLTDAQTLLLPDYSVGRGERIRPNQSAATALLARVLLYNHDWQGAVNQSTAVITNSSLYTLLPDLNQVFLANSQEAIWQLQPVTPSYNSFEGNIFILTSGPFSSTASITLSTQLLNSFEPGDLRKSNWTNADTTNGGEYYYPFKYKVKSSNTVTEYQMVLRVAEQYLIRAEAEAHLQNIPEAITDLNIIRERAGLPDLPSNLTEDQCLAAVAQERRIELFAEWGHRWLDLKKTMQATPVLAPIKTGWQATDTLYPIPQSEIQNDPNLTQNPGY